MQSTALSIILLCDRTVGRHGAGQLFDEQSNLRIIERHVVCGEDAPPHVLTRRVVQEIDTLDVVSEFFFWRTVRALRSVSRSLNPRYHSSADRDIHATSMHIVGPYGHIKVINLL